MAQLVEHIIMVVIAAKHIQAFVLFAYERNSNAAVYIQSVRKVTM